MKGNHLPFNLKIIDEIIEKIINESPVTLP
jgi:hypothetical protein